LLVVGSVNFPFKVKVNLCIFDKKFLYILFKVGQLMNSKLFLMAVAVIAALGIVVVTAGGETVFY
jgi:hypothetical protein